MLLNNDIQKKNCSNDFTFSKGNKCNYVCMEEKKLNLTLVISFEQNFNQIWIFKVYVFVMFKIKYLVNRMQCNTLLQQLWWVDGKGVCLHPKGQGSKPHKWCVCD